MIRVGIIGAAGYTAGELIRLLVNHPEVEIVFAHSESNAGNPVSDVHSGLIGDTDLRFCSDYNMDDIDVLFMCGAHGKSKEFWIHESKIQGTGSKEQGVGLLKVIDLAQDFRDESEGYVYGLPEWQKEKICGAQKVANPGCFATAIQLALLPLAGAGLLNNEVQITAITGSTGAGVKPAATTHFSWRSNNISTYKVFQHQHLIEIGRNLSLLQGRDVPALNFVPVRGDFTRGIFASVYTRCDLSEDEMVALYKDYYKDAAFTFFSDKPVDLKQVVNTNKCVLHIEKHDDKIVVSSVIDNLLKGASGQAVQNMNLMCGLDERLGLRLKASAF